MNKRSQSEKIMIKRNKNQGVSHAYLEKSHKNHQNQDSILKENTILHSKINESKSILETIYSKVKRKESEYQTKIVEANQKCQQLHQIGRQYKDFGEEQLRVIHTNSIVQKYNGLSNYLPNHTNEQLVKYGQNREIRQNYQSMKNLITNTQLEPTNIKNIVSEYKRKLSQNQGSSQNIYEMYLTRVNKNMRSSILSRDKTEGETAINKARRLSKEIEQDLQNLKLKKNMSSQNLKLKQCLPKNNINKDKKSYFLELQKRKLKIL